MKFSTAYDREGSLPWSSNKPSMTVPDMSMSVREIFQRFASGQPLTKNPMLNFTGDDYTPDIRGLDLVEVQQLYEQSQNDQETFKKQLNDLVKKQREEQQKADDYMKDKAKNAARTDNNSLPE